MKEEIGKKHEARKRKEDEKRNDCSCLPYVSRETYGRQLQ